MTDFQSFKVIPDFPDYVIGSKGEVYSVRTSTWLTHSLTEHGDPTVGLMKDGRQHRRSVKVLVARAYVTKPDPAFDTPILLDNNQTNVRADNIAWRPRWFAWRYFRQFENLEPWAYSGPLTIDLSGEEFQNIIHAAVVTGSLIVDIKRSLLNKVPVFPHGGIFKYIY